MLGMPEQLDAAVTEGMRRQRFQQFADQLADMIGVADDSEDFILAALLCDARERLIDRHLATGTDPSS